MDTLRYGGQALISVWAYEQKLRDNKPSHYVNPSASKQKNTNNPSANEMQSKLDIISKSTSIIEPVLVVRENEVKSNCDHVGIYVHYIYISTLININKLNTFLR